MLEYYLPGLDASTLSESQFIQKVGFLYVIREMERHDQVDNALKNIIG